MRVPLAMRRQMATRAPADQDCADCEEGAEWLRGRQMTRRALMIRAKVSERALGGHGSADCERT